MASGTTPREAAAAAKTILGYYSTIPAADPELFAAGLVKLLAGYSAGVLKVATDPVLGIPGAVSFLDLATIKGHLDRWHDLEMRRAYYLRPRDCIAAPENHDSHVRARMRIALQELSARLAAGLTP